MTMKFVYEASIYIKATSARGLKLLVDEALITQPLDGEESRDDDEI